MIVMIAEVTAQPGMGSDYEEIFLRLQKVVRVKEPKTILYQSGKSRDEDNTYRAIEIFEDQEAMDFHLASEWLASAWADMEKTVANLKVTVHDTL